MAATQYEFVYRNRYFLIIDVILFISSAFLSYALRLEVFTPADIAPGILLFLAISLSAKLLVFLLSGVYSRYWKNAGPSELLLIGRACLIAGFIVITATLFVTAISTYVQVPLPRSIAMIDFLLSTIMVTATRFSIRANAHIKQEHRLHTIDQTGKRALIIGAGQTGIQVLDAVGRNGKGIHAVGFLDDKADKVGTYVRGLKVLGKLADLPAIVSSQAITLVIIAIPSAPGSVIRQIVQACQKIGVEHQIVPGMYELVTGKITASALRPIAIEDLLRRTPVRLDVSDIQRQLQGRCIMVTGAGGSIGSELCRQIARCAPSRLLLVGHGENSLFSIEQKLKAEYPSVQCETLLVDIQDMPHLDAIFARWKPHTVFHAAAHKHVPMLEANVSAAVLNNIIGTRHLIDLCNRYDVARMILISTDKAVQPTSIMGMSKRAAELLILQAAQDQPSRFAAVRFGNVLGSRGSVVPIFQSQITGGGPVTVTSDKMTRFFMSISEAVLLVLKASVLINYGPLFVLNMGDPVRILDLAHDLIKLNGFEPGQDIEVRVTGIRPGEKIDESLFWEFERRVLVEQGSIYTLQLAAEQLQLVADKLPGRLEMLISAALKGDEQTARMLLTEVAFTIPNQPAQRPPEGSIAKPPPVIETASRVPRTV